MWQLNTFGQKPRTITKKELAKLVSSTMGLPIRKSKAIVSIVFSVLQAAISRGEEIIIPNLGTLSIRKAPTSRRLWRLGKIVTQFKGKKRIVFKPDKM